MNEVEFFQAIELILTFAIVPAFTLLWKINTRLSHIEGRLYRMEKTFGDSQ